MSVLANFKAMPTLVKWTTAHGLICVVLLAVSVAAYADASGGEPTPVGAAWPLGRLSWALALGGLLMPLSALLSLLRIGFGRYLYVSCFGIALVIPFSVSQNFLSAALGFGLVMLLTGYLFLNRDVAAYFSARL